MSLNDKNLKTENTGSTIKPHYAEFLTILKNAPSTGITTAEVFKQSCDNPKSQITDPEQLSKMIYSMRHNGYIVTLAVGKKKAHRITDKGFNKLAEFNGLTITPHKKVEEMTEEQDRYDTNAPVSALFDGGEIAAEELFYLDQNNAIEAAFTDLIILLREAQNQPEPYKIERKTLKIETLAQIGALLSDDIKRVFDEIIDDLARFEEVNNDL